MAILLEELTRKVIGAFFFVYAKLGEGLLENAYTGALELELVKRGHSVKREVPVAVSYEGVIVGHYRIDLLIDDLLILEIKTGPSIRESDERQLRNYLRCSNLEVGLVFLFGPQPKFRRFVYSNDRKQHIPEKSSRHFPPLQR